MLAVVAERVRVCVLFAVARYVILIKLHYQLVQLVVQLFGYDRVLLIQIVFQNELPDEGGTRWHLTLCSCQKELQNVLIRLLVLFIVVLDDHEVSNQWDDTWEIR